MSHNKTDLKRQQKTITAQDQQHIMALVKDVAKKEILPRFKQLSSTEIATKSSADDLVTIADLVTEEALTKRIKKLFPEALIVGEEAVAKAPALRNKMSNHPFVFVIDPVDGTWNFAAGLPLFGVIISVLSYGTPIFGLLYDPISDDFIITSSEHKKTEFISKNNTTTSLILDETKNDQKPSGFLHFHLLPKDIQKKISPQIAQFHYATSLRCSCHEYRLLAQGKVDFCLSAVLNPWDHAAGVCAVLNAGGVAKMFDGRDYNTSITTGYLLVTRSNDVWSEVFTILESLVINEQLI